MDDEQAVAHGSEAEDVRDHRPVAARQQLARVCDQPAGAAGVFERAAPERERHVACLGCDAEVADNRFHSGSLDLCNAGRISDFLRRFEDRSDEALGALRRSAELLRNMPANWKRFLRPC